MTDWLNLYHLIEAEQGKMIWDETCELNGDEFYAEALRRVIERDYPVTGLTTVEAADKRCRDAEATRDFNRDQVYAARKQVGEVVREGRENTRKAHAANGVVYGQMLRDKAPSVLSKFRREGVLLAAYWLDGKHPGRDTKED